MKVIEIVVMTIIPYVEAKTNIELHGRGLLSYISRYLNCLFA